VSVVAGASRRRWAGVALGVVVLLAAPAAVAATVDRASTGTASPVLAPASLARLVLRSTSVPYSGLTEISANLGLPDLPRLGDLAARLGGTTTARVWWQGPDHYRVATVTTTGEQDLYRSGPRLVTWDYEQGRLTEVIGTPPVRFPRTDDLIPPQVARRALAAAGPDDLVQSLPGRRRVAGLVLTGLRLVPADSRSTVGHVDLWVHPGTGLPVQVIVVDRSGATSLVSQFLEVALAAPAPLDVQVPAATGAVHDTTTTPDLATRIQQVGAWRLPDSLAGLAVTTPAGGGTAVYGSGLVRFTVLPVSSRLAGQLLSAAHNAQASSLPTTGGEALAITAGLFNLVVARGTGEPPGQQHAYLVAGPVSVTVLQAATQQLLADPPPPRRTT